MITPSVEVEVPARVLFICLLLDLQFLDKHFLLIIVIVDPESSNTFSKTLDLTEEMVSTTMMVSGVRLFVLGTAFVGLSISSLLSSSSDMAYTSSA